MCLTLTQNKNKAFLKARKNTPTCRTFPPHPNPITQTHSSSLFVSQTTMFLPDSLFSIVYFKLPLSVCSYFRVARISMICCMTVHICNMKSFIQTLNGATCQDRVNMYTCSCPAGFTGVNCENRCTFTIWFFLNFYLYIYLFLRIWHE
jgi:hypothetical protein